MRLGGLSPLTGTEPGIWYCRTAPEKSLLSGLCSLVPGLSIHSSFCFCLFVLLKLSLPKTSAARWCLFWEHPLLCVRKGVNPSPCEVHIKLVLCGYARATSPIWLLRCLHSRVCSGYLSAISLVLLKHICLLTVGTGAIWIASMLPIYTYLDQVGRLSKLISQLLRLCLPAETRLECIFFECLYCREA